MIPPQYDWSDLWQKTIGWATQPVKGVVIPATEVQDVAEDTFESFLEQFRKLPLRDEALAFLEKTSRQLSLEMVAKARHRAARADLWRDADWTPGGEGLFPEHLNSESAAKKTAAWQILVRDLKSVALPIIQRKGVPEADAEEVYFQTLAYLDRGRQESSARPLDQVLVYEQIPRLVAVMAGNLAVDWMRALKTRKNSPNDSSLIESIDENEALGNSIADPNASRWLDDPFAGLTFDRIHSGCKDVLTPVQWRIITEVFIDETSILKICDDEDLMKDLELPRKASVATRRRRIGDQLQLAFAGLQRCLESRELWTAE